MPVGSWREETCDRFSAAPPIAATPQRSPVDDGSGIGPRYCRRVIDAGGAGSRSSQPGLLVCGSRRFSSPSSRRQSKQGRLRAAYRSAHRLCGTLAKAFMPAAAIVLGDRHESPRLASPNTPLLRDSVLSGNAMKARSFYRVGQKAAADPVGRALPLPFGSIGPLHTANGDPTLWRFRLSTRGCGH